MNRKKFYDAHKNFAHRTFLEYNISPGIKCKFDIIVEKIASRGMFCNALDLGCSGNSILYFCDNISNKSFFDITLNPIRQFKSKKEWHPLCGDITYLPFRNKSFDLVTMLDVLEHIKDDEMAVSEVSRILKKKGLVIITVPHRMRYYTLQDKIIGHYRRYEIKSIIRLFQKYNLHLIEKFGVYGYLMRFSDIQSIHPEKLEEKLDTLRQKYATNLFFKQVWDIFISISSYIMKLDAKYQSLNKIMNLGFVFEASPP